MKGMGNINHDVHNTGGRGAKDTSASSEDTPQLTVYSLEFCPNCEILKEYLKSQGLRYIEKDLASREPLAELRIHGVFVREAPVLRKDNTFLTSDQLFKSGKLMEEKIKQLLAGE